MAHTRLTTDAFGALETLDAAVRLRAAHGSFDLVLRLDDDRGRVAALLARDICHRYPDERSRRGALDQLESPDAAIGQNPLIRFATMDIATKATVRDVALLARSLVFRSWAEMRRAVMNFDILHQSYVIEASGDALVPDLVSQRRTPDGSLLIWAPDEPIDHLSIVLTAAAQTGRVVRVVCQGGDALNFPIEIVAREDVTRALACASICVAASLSDPGPAIALAKWGIPLCATFTSGAYEWIESVVSYRSWSMSSAAAAMAHAFAAPLPSPSSMSRARVATTEIPINDALVTIVVRTQGDMISSVTAESIAGQMHASCEVLVAPTAQAVREACSAARGAYIAILHDGDILFREGLAALVNALESSRGDLAYGNGLFAYLVDAPGHQTVIGYSVLERVPVQARTVGACDEFSGSYFRVLFRRELLVKTGLRDDLDGLMVYDAFLRALDHANAVHVDEVCGMSCRYVDGRAPGEPKVSHLREYESIYARVPTADDAVRAARDAVRLHLQSHDRIGLRPPPQRLSPPRPLH